MSTYVIDRNNEGIYYCELHTNWFVTQKTGQVAQLVEHGPEKAGVGGSSPPLTTFPVSPDSRVSPQRTKTPRRIKKAALSVLRQSGSLLPFTQSALDG